MIVEVDTSKEFAAEIERIRHEARLRGYQVVDIQRKAGQRAGYVALRRIKRKKQGKIKQGRFFQ